MENPLQENDLVSGTILNTDGEARIQVRVPKRIIHCSDGVLEEYSDEETDDNKPSVDPKNLTWGPWLLHYAWASGNKALEYCDYVGEGLADFLHITTPKYQLEMSEYERLEAAKKKEQEESAGWMTTNNENGTAMVTIQPSTVYSPSDKPVAL